MRTLQYRQVYDFIKEILTPFKNYLLVFIALVTFESFEFVIQPYLMKLVVDGLHQSSSKLSLGVLTTVPIIPLGLYLGFSWLTLLITRIYEWLEIEFYPTLKTRVIRKLVQHIMHHSHGFYQNQLPGSLTSKINEVSTSIQKLVVTCIERFYGYSSRLLLTIIILSQVQVIFAIMMSCWAVFFFLFSWHWSKKAKDYAEKSAEAMNSVWGSIVDLFSNAALMRFFTAWDFERKYLKRLTEHSKKSQKFFAYYLFKKRLIYGVSYRMLETLSIIVLVSAYKKSLITVGDFVLILTLNSNVADCLWGLSKELPLFAEQWAKVSQGVKLLHAHDISDKPQALPLQITSASIEWKDVCFSYSDSPCLFKNLSLSFKPGEKIGLVGYSGSGKSTFVHLLLRLYDLDSGKILIDNQDISHVLQDSLRDAITFIPQDPCLFHRTVADNIRYGSPLATLDEVRECAKLAHADDFILQLTDGYESLVGDRGAKLSGGQRQRIAIARAFLKKSPIIILDEATSSLDSLTEKLIQDSLLKLLAHRTSIVIAHRLSTLLCMDRILVFDKGSVIQNGSHQELISIPGLYQQLWQAQKEGFLPKNELKP